MPISCRTALRSLPLIAVKFRPSKCTDPVSGSINPTVHFVMTDLPLPLRPITKFTLPGSNRADTPFNTWCSPKDFWMSRSSINSMPIV